MKEDNVPQKRPDDDRGKLLKNLESLRRQSQDDISGLRKLGHAERAERIAKGCADLKDAEKLSNENIEKALSKAEKTLATLNPPLLPDPDKLPPLPEVPGMIITHHETGGEIYTAEKTRMQRISKDDPQAFFIEGWEYSDSKWIRSGGTNEDWEAIDQDFSHAYSFEEMFYEKIGRKIVIRDFYDDFFPEDYSRLLPKLSDTIIYLRPVEIPRPKTSKTKAWGVILPHSVFFACQKEAIEKARELFENPEKNPFKYWEGTTVIYHRNEAARKRCPELAKLAVETHIQDEDVDAKEVFLLKKHGKTIRTTRWNRQTLFQGKGTLETLKPTKYNWKLEEKALAIWFPEGTRKTATLAQKIGDAFGEGRGSSCFEKYPGIQVVAWAPPIPKPPLSEHFSDKEWWDATKRRLVEEKGTLRLSKKKEYVELELVTIRIESKKEVETWTIPADFPHDGSSIDHYRAAQKIARKVKKGSDWRTTLKKLGWLPSPTNNIVGDRHLEITHDGSVWVHLQDILEDQFTYGIELGRWAASTGVDQRNSDEENWNDFAWGHWVCFYSEDVAYWTIPTRKEIEDNW